jgi:hypothetical protein
MKNIILILFLFLSVSICKAEVIPVPPPPTPQAVAATRIVTNGNQVFKFLVSQFMVSYNLIWKNKDATPQQVYDELEATNPGHGVPATVLATATALATLINSVVPKTLPDPLKTLTTNKDGTVTVGQ